MKHGDCYTPDLKSDQLQQNNANDPFDPKATALELEESVKTFLDNGLHRANAVDSSVIASEALKKVTSQIEELYKDPKHLASVAKELEKITAENFNTLPNVVVKAENGRVQSLEFTASFWDWKGKYDIDGLPMGVSVLKENDKPRVLGW